MASITSGAIASVSRAMHNPSQACMVPHSPSPKSNSVFPVTRKLSNDLTLTSSSGNGGRVQSMLMQVSSRQMQEVSVLEARQSFSSYASFDFAETKPKDLGVSCSFAFNETVNKEEETKEADGFEFEALCGDHEVLTISADEIFLNGKIRSMPPLAHVHSEAKTVRNKLKKFLEEERVLESKCVGEEEVLDPETFCEWKPKSSSKKSSSTNSSRRWKLRDLIRRSNSEGGETMVSGKEALPAREVKVKSAHEIHYTKNRAMKEADRRRSFLPYRQDLVGLFGNVNGLSKALKPILR